MIHRTMNTPRLVSFQSAAGIVRSSFIGWKNKSSFAVESTYQKKTPNTYARGVCNGDIKQMPLFSWSFVCKQEKNSTFLHLFTIFSNILA